MIVEVVILPQGSGQPLVPPWRESDSFEHGAYKFQEDRWREFVRLRARRALGSGKLEPVEIFLCLRGDHLVGRYDTHFIAALLKLARAYCWGEKIYLAVNWRVSMHEEQARWLDSLFAWFQTVFENGAADVIEEEIDNDCFKEWEGYALSHGARLSRKRHAELARGATPGGWRCVLPGSAQQGQLPALLSPFVQPRRADWQERGNLITLVDHGEPAVQTGLVKAALKKYYRARLAVVLSGYGVSASPALQELCQLAQLPLIECRGAFELRALLLHHNQQPQPNGLSAGWRVEKVKIERSPYSFSKERQPGLPGLLLTSSFDDSDIRQCLEAACDAGVITQGLPPWVNYWVHPGIRSQALPDVLKTATPLTAWVFLGHGEGKRGLKSGAPDKLEKPEYWLRRFKDYGQSLALAFFAACRSAETAYCFAKAGVGVAIGFEARVLPAACRLLAAEVVRAALLTNGNQQAILDAYRFGCRQLEPRGLSDARPKAFFSVG